MAAEASSTAASSSPICISALARMTSALRAWATTSALASQAATASSNSFSPQMGIRQGKPYDPAVDAQAKRLRAIGDGLATVALLKDERARGLRRRTRISDRGEGPARNRPLHLQDRPPAGAWPHDKRKPEHNQMRRIAAVNPSIASRQSATIWSGGLGLSR